MFGTKCLLGSCLSNYFYFIKFEEQAIGDWRLDFRIFVGSNIPEKVFLLSRCRMRRRKEVKENSAAAQRDLIDGTI